MKQACGQEKETTNLVSHWNLGLLRELTLGPKFQDNKIASTRLPSLPRAPLKIKNDWALGKEIRRVGPLFLPDRHKLFSVSLKEKAVW